VKARLVEFGKLEIEGKRYERDVVIDAGTIRRRKKGPSKSRRTQFGHTPLTSAEDIPWGGRLLIVGTGANGSCRSLRISTRRPSDAESESRRCRPVMPAACSQISTQSMCTRFSTSPVDSLGVVETQAGGW
jgi:hypothetical protein